MRNALTQRRATSLRKRMTDSENKVWSRLRGRQINGRRFRRQVPIGPYIVDFACVDIRLVIEIDGGQHVDSSHDRRRDEYITDQGFRILRFWSNEALTQTDAVVERIFKATKMPPP